MKRWGSKWMPLALKTGLCQSDRPGDSGSSDDANSAAGRCRRVTRRSCPRHHWPITRSWGVVRFPPRVRSRDVRGTRARGRCNRIPYALRLRWHGGRQRSITSPFQAAATRSGATRHTSTPMSSGSSRPEAGACHAEKAGSRAAGVPHTRDLCWRGLGDAASGEGCGVDASPTGTASASCQ